jgi:hypothetical protein
MQAISAMGWELFNVKVSSKNLITNNKKESELI